MWLGYAICNFEIPEGHPAKAVTNVVAANKEDRAVAKAMNKVYSLYLLGVSAPYGIEARAQAIVDHVTQSSGTAELNTLRDVLHGAASSDVPASLVAQVDSPQLSTGAGALVAGYWPGSASPMSWINGNGYIKCMRGWWDLNVAHAWKSQTLTRSFSTSANIATQYFGGEGHLCALGDGGSVSSEPMPSLASAAPISAVVVVMANYLGWRRQRAR